MPAIPIILRLLPYVLAAAAIGFVLWQIYSSIYESGRSDEREVWVEREQEATYEANKLLEESNDRYQQALDKQHSDLIGAFNESEKLRIQLAVDLADSANKRMRVKAVCNKSGGDKAITEDRDSSRTDKTVGNVQLAELDESTARNIRRDYAEVANAAIDINQLLNIIKTSQCIDIK